MSVKVFDESGNVTAEALDAIFRRWPAEPIGSLTWMHTERHVPRGVLRDAYSQAQPTLVSNEPRKDVLHQVEPLRDIGLGKAIADAVTNMLRENPPPPDALLPEGCTRWVLATRPPDDDRPDVFWFKWEAAR